MSREVRRELPTRPVPLVLRVAPGVVGLATAGLAVLLAAGPLRSQGDMTLTGEASDLRAEPGGRACPDTDGVTRGWALRCVRDDDDRCRSHLDEDCVVWVQTNERRCWVPEGSVRFRDPETALTEPKSTCEERRRERDRAAVRDLEKLSDEGRWKAVIDRVEARKQKKTRSSSEVKAQIRKLFATAIDKEEKRARRRQRNAQAAEAKRAIDGILSTESTLLAPTSWRPVGARPPKGKKAVKKLAAKRRARVVALLELVQRLTTAGTTLDRLISKDAEALELGDHRLRASHAAARAIVALASTVVSTHIDVLNRNTGNRVEEVRVFHRLVEDLRCTGSKGQCRKLLKSYRGDWRKRHQKCDARVGKATLESGRIEASVQIRCGGAPTNTTLRYRFDEAASEFVPTAGWKP